MALWPARYGAEHPVDVRFVPTEAERRHKSGTQASRYANIGQGAVCQWHTFSTDRSGNGDVDVRSTEQSVRHLLTLTLYHIVQQKKSPWIRNLFLSKGSLFASTRVGISPLLNAS